MFGLESKQRTGVAPGVVDLRQTVALRYAYLRWTTLPRLPAQPISPQVRYIRMTSTPHSTTSQSSQTPNDGGKKQPFVMTDEMEAKQQARREAKLAKKAANRAVNGDGETTSGATTPGGSQILRREWKRLPAKERPEEGERSQTFRLLTWNMLAQTLVRELIPTAQSGDFCQCDWFPLL